MKEEIIEFKFKNLAIVNSLDTMNKYWQEIIARYFKEVHNIDDIRVDIRYPTSSTVDGFGIGVLMPHTTNAIYEIVGKYIPPEDDDDEEEYEGEDNSEESGEEYIPSDEPVKYANFSMYGMNNCCGAMCTSNTNVYAHNHRNKKLATLLQYYKNAIAASLRISKLYCTDVYYKTVPEGLTNEQIDRLPPYLENSKVLLNTGWKIVDKFKNKKSSNIVALYSKDVRLIEEEITMKIKKVAEAIVEIKNPTIGCDPELFLRDVETQEYVPSYQYIKGDKQNPEFITDDGHNIQCDNVMVEYGVPPSDTAEEFVKNNMIVQDYLREKIAEPNGLELVIFPYAKFTENNLKDDRAQTFGCDPDYNAWMQGRPNIVGRPDELGRSAGGHIHIGYDGFNQVTNHAIIKALDLFIGVPLVIMEPENLRKTMYGKAGAYRNQAWGVEYRVTSNYIFSSPELMKWAFNQVQEAIKYVNDNKGYKNLYEYSSVEWTINNQSIESARKITSRMKIKVLEPALAEK